jgi:outer membrane beta-barrel protein
MLHNLLKTLLFAVPLLVGGAAVAQDDPDDDLGGIIGTDTAPPVDEHDVDTKPATPPAVDLPSEKTHRVIKTLQRKTFLKLNRYEGAFQLGFVTNDPFINRYIIGAGIAYHITEIFAVELLGNFSPDFGEADWKGVTEQLVHENRVSPDISKILYFGQLNFQFSPIYGKVAVGQKIINFDIFGTFGTGIVNTKDDLEALQCTDDPSCIATQSQFHPTTNFGGGFRIIFSRNVALRLEGRSMVYIETIDSTTLEMKNNFMILASGTYFFPNMD